jgi:hypothetical protein
MAAVNLRIGIILCILLVTGYSTYRHRFRLRAFVWHAVHGSSIKVGGYRIEVPQYWFVEQHSNDAQLWNSRTGESIWIRFFPKPANFTLGYWRDMMQKGMNSPENPIIARRDLQIDGQPFVCFERDFAVTLPAAVATRASTNTIHMPNVDCNSAAPLQIMFFGGMWTAQGRDYRDFYSMIASIQKAR